MEESPGICDKMDAYLKEFQNWTLWRTIIVGQFLSLTLCVLQYISHQLSTTYHLTIPTSQNYLRYMMMCCVFTTILAFRRGERGLFNIIKLRGYRYILIGLVDLEANTLIAMSHQFSSLISIQFLDCVTLPVSIILCCLTLGVRFRFVHMLGVSICLLGVGSLVWAGVRGIPDNEDRMQLVGDMLCVSGSILFAVLCVLQELVSKTLDCIECLGMIGLFGCCLCGIQMFLIEKQTLMTIDWSNYEMLGYLVAFAVVQFIFYSLLPNLLQQAGSTAVQLYLLTADFYTLVGGMITFQYKFHGFYLLSYFLTMTGIYTYSIKRLTLFNLTGSNEVLEENGLSSEALNVENNNRDYSTLRSREHFEMNATVQVPTIAASMADDMNLNVSTIKLQQQPSTTTTIATLLSNNNAQSSSSSSSFYKC